MKHIPGSLSFPGSVPSNWKDNRYVNIPLYICTSVPKYQAQWNVRSEATNACHSREQTLISPAFTGRGLRQVSRQTVRFPLPIPSELCSKSELPPPSRCMTTEVSINRFENQPKNCISTHTILAKVRNNDVLAKSLSESSFRCWTRPYPSKSGSVPTFAFGI